MVVTSSIAVFPLVSDSPFILQCLPLTPYYAIPHLLFWFSVLESQERVCIASWPSPFSEFLYTKHRLHERRVFATPETAQRVPLAVLT